MTNQSDSFEVILVGFPGLPQHLHGLVSAMMFLIYMTSLAANGSVIGLVTLNPRLHQPMYLLIANLAASDVLFDTITLPKLIARYWFGSSTIAFKVCVFQMFWIHHLGSLDSFLLLLMAIDRYVAISQPLRYGAIINNRTVIIACGFCWVFLAPSTKIFHAIEAFKIALCEVNNKINTLYCSHAAIAALSCGDAAHMKQVAFISAMVVLLVPLSLILFSYIMIITVIARSKSSANWQKAFYTCGTHLFLVALYYVLRIFVYIVTNIPVIVIKADVNAVLLFLYSIAPHVGSPFVYFLRTKEIRQTVRKVFQKLKVVISVF
ncbi:PREDICTED: olfactory receptor 1-like [Nanorana parkeri]|uniref:olfactory receptor 1-like n=1 Tax=Nanorana parkeri TaxID=125878 RepID=UPI000854B040|nr:PREDICTED: olfactory receptor 1-like [Nanorana parkeri]